MNKLIVGWLALTMALGAGALFLQHEAKAELQAEIAALRADVLRLSERQKDAAGASRPQVTVAVEEVNAANDQRTELAKLREELVALKKSTQEIARVAQAAQSGAKGESTIPVALTPVGSLKNAGRATVKAALETVFAAATGGDVDTLASSIMLTPQAEAKAAAWFAGLSDEARTQYGSPEKVVALMLAKDAAGVTGIQVLGQRDLSADTIGVRVRIGDEQGNTKEQGLAFQQTPDGLKALIPDNVLERYAKQLRGGK